MEQIKILVINLKKRQDRWDRVSKMLSERQLDFERIDAIEDEKGAIGCAKSHIKALQYAKSKGLKEVIIMEDDFIFIGEGNFIYPPICDVCLYSCKLNRNEPYDDNFYRVLDGRHTDFYFIREHYYDTLIECWNESLIRLTKDYTHSNYIDVYWISLQKKDLFLTPKIRLGYQIEDYSDIIKQKINRKTDLEYTVGERRKMELEKRKMEKEKRMKEKKLS